MKNCFRQIDAFLASEPDPAFARRARIIFTKLALRGHEKVLDVGCGRGFYTNALANFYPQLTIVGIDTNQSYLDIAKKNNIGGNVKYIRTKADQLPFSDQYFDRVIASEMLEHVTDDYTVLTEIYRVLKPGGIVMITVPNQKYPFCWDPLNWTLEKILHIHIPNRIWWLAGIWADHRRLYTQAKITTKIKAAGFTILKSWTATHYCFPFAHFLLYGVGKNLVEKGLCSNCNRFCSHTRHPSPLWRFVIWFWYAIDRLNNSDTKYHSTVNLIYQAGKCL